MTHTLNVSLNSPSGAIAASLTHESEQSVEMDIVMASDATNVAVAFAATLAKVKSLVIQSDQACTIKTNSSSTPQETITLVANKPFIVSDAFNPSLTATDFFAGAITALYVTNTSSPATAGTVKLRAIIDPT